MGNLKIRSSGGGGGIKFKRTLSVDWRIEQLTSENLLGSTGKLERAIVFGDPTSSGASNTVQDVEFKNFCLSDSVKLYASTGRQHKIVSGPFFKGDVANLTEAENRLLGVGSWIPNLPQSAGIILEINDLKPDVVYEVRCIFFDGKRKASRNMALLPGDIEVIEPSYKIIVGEFIAPDTTARLQLQSMDEGQPYINAIVLRTIDYVARIKSVVRIA